MRQISQLALLLMLAGPAVAQEDGAEVSYLRNLTVEKGQIRGDAICIGCSARVIGTVNGDLVTVGGDIEIEGVVLGDAVAAGGRVRVLEGARLDGDAIAVGGTVERAKSARVTGDSESIPYFHLPGQRSFHWIGVLALLGYTILAALVVGLPLRRHRNENLRLAVRGHYLLVTAIGVALITLFILALELLDRPGTAFTILQMTFCTVLLVLPLVGCATVPWLLGRGVFKNRGSPVTLLAGGLALWVLMLIPLGGFVVFLVALVLSYGAPLVSGFGSDADWLTLRVFRGKPTRAT